MALKLDLKPEQRARIERITCEVLRLYALTPRWLARYLLTTARDLRRFCAWGPMDCIYDARLLWQLIPELAYRLGEARFLADERIDGEVRCMSDDMLRCQVLMALRNVSIHAYWHSPSAHVFFHEVANGNPVVFGVDHLVAPGPGDWAAQYLAEIALRRGARDFHGKWTPGWGDQGKGGLWV